MVRHIASIKTLLLLIVMAVGVAEAYSQEPVENGEYYLIQNENNEKMYYLLPASHQYYQGNAATPYLRTAMTARETVPTDGC